MKKYYQLFSFLGVICFLLLAKNPVIANDLNKKHTNKINSKSAVSVATSIYATDDINQIPQNQIILSNVLSNDIGINLTVETATFYDISYQEQNLPLNTATSIYDINGYHAGELTLNVDGSYTFQPRLNYVGDVNIKYIAKDNLGDTDTATLFIKVLADVDLNQNNRPIAQNDTGFTKMNIPLVSTLLSNDSDPDGDVLTITDARQNNVAFSLQMINQVSGVDDNGNSILNAGKIGITPNGGYNFLPATGFTGKINPITYSIRDSKGGTNKAKLFIRVLENDGVNSTFANDDANVAPMGEVMNGNVLLNDNDSENQSQTVKLIRIDGVEYLIPTNGSVLTIEIPNKGSIIFTNSGNYTFIPLPNFTGTWEVKVNVCDSGSPIYCDSSTLYLTSLPIDKTCYENVEGNPFSWVYTSTDPIITRIINEPATDGSLVFDIYRLDNSFNMEINGVLLATNEIQFENNSQMPRNIRFITGSSWGAGGVPHVWNIQGTPTRPALRVIINKNGFVSMYGSRTNGGPLFPLELYNNVNFNRIPLNSTVNNEIIITQTVSGYTRMVGSAFVQNLIPCPCAQPGNFSSTGLPTNVGITSLREGNSNNWPHVREGAWIALESKTKGFVPNRLTNLQIDAIPESELVVGMMVYNITEDCLQINTNGFKSGWQCFDSQSCD